MPTPHRIPHHIADLPLRGQRNNLNLLNYFRIRILRISHRSTLLSTQLHPSLSLSNTHENKPEQEIWGGEREGVQSSPPLEVRRGRGPASPAGSLSGAARGICHNAHYAMCDRSNRCAAKGLAGDR